MLKAELPAAASVTGSLNSRTVIWSRAVAKWRTSLFGTDCRVSSAGRERDITAATRTSINVRFIMISIAPEILGPGSRPVSSSRLLSRGLCFRGLRQRSWLEEELPVLVLKQECLLRAVFGFFHQKGAALVIEVAGYTGKIGKSNANGRAASALRQLDNHLLREGVKQNRAAALAVAYH